MNGNAPKYISEFRITQNPSKTTQIDPNQLEFIKSQQKLGIPIAVTFSFEISATPIQLVCKQQALYSCSLSMSFSGEVKSTKQISLATFNAHEKSIELQFKSNMATYFQQNSFFSFDATSKKAVIGSSTTGYYTSTGFSVASDDPSTLILDFSNLTIPKEYSHYKDYEITGTLTMTLSLTIKPQLPPPKTYIGSYTRSQQVQWYLEHMNILAMDPGAALLDDNTLNDLLFKYHQANLNNQNIKLPTAPIAAGILGATVIACVFVLAV